jgi:hypothetical protein
MLNIEQMRIDILTILPVDQSLFPIPLLNVPGKGKWKFTPQYPRLFPKQAEAGG